MLRGVVFGYEDVPACYTPVCLKPFECVFPRRQDGFFFEVKGFAGYKIVLSLYLTVDLYQRLLIQS